MWSTLRRLEETRYLFEIDDVMLNDEYGAIKLRLSIAAGGHKGRHVTAHVFHEDEDKLLHALGVSATRPEEMKGKFVRASIRRRRRRKDGSVVLVVENWEPAETPPSTLENAEVVAV